MKLHKFYFFDDFTGKSEKCLGFRNCFYNRNVTIASMYRINNTKRTMIASRSYWKYIYRNNEGKDWNGGEE